MFKKKSRTHRLKFLATPLTHEGYRNLVWTNCFLDQLSCWSREVEIWHLETLSYPKYCSFLESLRGIYIPPLRMKTWKFRFGRPFHVLYCFYRKSLNIRCPQKIVAPDFSLFLILLRVKHIGLFSILSYFCSPYLKGLHLRCIFLSNQNTLKDSLNKETKVGKVSHTTFWGFMVFVLFTLTCEILIGIPLV